MKITVNLRHLKAAALFSSKRDVRYYLMGVYVDTAARTLVATDGNACYIGKPGEAVTALSEDAHSVILPNDFVGFILKQKTVYENVVITVADSKASCDIHGAAMSMAVIDGKFPDWRRIYPGTLTNEAGLYQPLIWAQIVKASQALGDREGFAGMFQNGAVSGVAVIQTKNATAHVVASPIRTTSKNSPTFTRFEV